MSGLLRVLLVSLLWLGLFAGQAAGASLTQTLLEQLPPADAVRPKLAVLDLVDLEGKSSKLGSHLAEGLLGELFAAKRFVLLERSLIQQVIKEQGFSQSALADAEQLIELGRLSGAQQLLTGRYSVLPDQIEVTLRLLDTRSGEILALSSASLPKTDAMRHLLGEKTLVENVANTGLDLLGRLADTVTQNPDLLAAVLQGMARPDSATAPVLAPGIQKQRVFYEDFSRFAVGTPLPELGPYLVVRSSQRYAMNVLTSEHPSAAFADFKLAFPEDFVLEIHAIDTLLDARQLSTSPLGLLLVDAMGQPLTISKQAHGFALPGTGFKPSPWRYQGWNVIGLVRQGDLFRLYINGQLVNESRYPGFGRIIRFQLSVPQMRQWAFTRLSVFGL